ncbi:hypothetical protein FXO38_17952 [Capsicum annuum]|uniref:Pentatricopeptide repeat-containing protein n=1 Tax=Capsicum annuum TaxID=4072 RepID=A0A2G2ZXJ9_CAPAN|nr:hypothetical protein FXO37_33163 [Capsicum annuum]KAF3648883.1 hypothetical protein FXO38_17952 [Capsicum annuum]PHT86717.1 hypothetical protein T459_08823 [Capsicum annuum]
MIRGYVKDGDFMKGLELLRLMLNSGTHPNHFMFSTILDASAVHSVVLMGNQVHTCFLKSGFPLDVVLLTSLVDTYTKCGDIEVTLCIFESIPVRNLVAWNSIIGGYARDGLAERAIQKFERMLKSGISLIKLPLLIWYMRVIQISLFVSLILLQQRSPSWSADSVKAKNIHQHAITHS